MSRKNLYLLAAVIVLIAGTVLAWRLFRPDPVYHGRRLSYWVRQVSHVPQASREIVPREATLRLPDRLAAGDASKIETNQTLFSSRQTTLDFSVGNENIPRVSLAKIRPPSPLVPKSQSTNDHLHAADSDWYTKSERDCLTTIRALGPDGISCVLRLLERDDPELNRNAAWALGEIGPVSPSVMPALVKMYQSHDSRFKRAWLWFLQRMPHFLSSRFPPPISRVAERRSSAARAIIKISDRHRFAGPSAPTHANPARPAVKAFLAELSNSDWQVRQETAAFLGDLGPDASAAIPELLRRLGDNGEAPVVREAYARTLGKIGVASDEVVSALVAAADDRWDLIRYAAIRSLGDLGAGAKAAVPYLTNALKNSDWGTRRRAYDALELIDPETVRDVYRGSNPRVEWRGRYLR